MNTAELVKGKGFLLSFILIAFCYLLLFVSLMPHDSIWISDEGNRIIAARSYAETSEKYIPDSLAGLKNPPKTGIRPCPPPYFVQEKESGRWHSAYSAFFPWCMSFLYRAGGRPALVLFPVLAGLLTILLAGFMARELKLNKIQSGGVMLLCAFATPFLFYSGVFLETTAAAALAAAGILMMLKSFDAENQELPYLFLGGLFIGGSTLFREEGFILAFAGVLALAVVHFSWKRLIIYMLGTGCLLLPLMIFNVLDSGSIFGLHAQIYNSIKPAARQMFLLAKLRGYSCFLTRLCMRHPLWNDLPGLLLLTGGILCAIPKTRRIAEPVVFPLIAALCLLSTVLNITDSKTGFFIYQSLLDHLPIFALCVFSAVVLFRAEDPKVRLLTWIAAAVILLAPAMLDERTAGMFWGGRHFMNIIPLTAVLTVWLISGERLSRAARYGAYALIFASFAASWTGYGALYSKKCVSQAIFDELDRPEIKLIATDVFWLPEELAWLPRDTKIWFLTEGDSIEKAADLCKVNGIEDFHLVLGLRSRVLTNGSIAKVFERHSVTPGRLLAPGRLNFFTVQPFHIRLIPENSTGKQMP